MDERALLEELLAEAKVLRRELDDVKREALFRRVKAAGALVTLGVRPQRPRR